MIRPFGDQSAVAPPVPIPNTEVKRCSADGSASIGCARVGHRQSYAPSFGNKAWGIFLYRNAELERVSRRVRRGSGWEILNLSNS